MIDANVVLDYLLVRQPQFPTVFQLINLCQKLNVKIFIAFHTVSIVWYHLRKYPKLERRKLLLNVTDVIKVTSAPHEKVVDAIKQENFSDFEDCLQEKCAEEINADYIVTNNVKDFSASKIPALSPREMLETIFEIKFNELNNL